MCVHFFHRFVWLLFTNLSHSLRAMLNRWIRMKQDEGKPKNKRPFLASECDNVNNAERWRRDVQMPFSATDYIASESQTIASWKTGVGQMYSEVINNSISVSLMFCSFVQIVKDVGRKISQIQNRECQVLFRSCVHDSWWLTDVQLVWGNSRSGISTMRSTDCWGWRECGSIGYENWEGQIMRSVLARAL